MTTHTKTINDIHGEPHQYQLVEYGYEEGTELYLILSEIMAAGGATIMPDGDGNDSQEASFFAALGVGVRELIKRGGPALLLRFQRGMVRDGEKLDQATAKLIYRSNYGEQLEAVRWAIEVNFGPFLRDLSRRFRLGTAGMNAVGGLFENSSSSSEGTGASSP